MMHDPRLGEDHCVTQLSHGYFRSIQQMMAFCA